MFYRQILAFFFTLFFLLCLSVNGHAHAIDRWQDTDPDYCPGVACTEQTDTCCDEQAEPTAEQLREQDAADDADDALDAAESAERDAAHRRIVYAATTSATRRPGRLNADLNAPHHSLSADLTASAELAPLAPPIKAHLPTLFLILSLMPLPLAGLALGSQDLLAWMRAKRRARLARQIKTSCPVCAGMVQAQRGNAIKEREAIHG